jgi:hypothetical protein
MSFENTDSAYSASFINKELNLDIVKIVLLTGKSSMCNVLDIFRVYIVFNLSGLLLGNLL